jgi:hypothetical protein
MSYAAAVSIILIAAIVAAFATAFIHRRVGIDLRRHHHEVGSVVFLQLGVVFAVLLASSCSARSGVRLPYVHVTARSSALLNWQVSLRSSDSQREGLPWVKALNRYHDSPLRRAARGDRLREVS